MHHQMVDGEYVRILVGALGQQAQLGVVGNDFVDQDRHLARFGPVLRPALRGRRNLDEQALQLDLMNLPRLPQQSHDSGIGREFGDRYHGRNIGPAFVPQDQSGAHDARSGKQIDVEVLELHLGMKFLA